MILECQEEKKELPKLYQKIQFTWVCFFFFLLRREGPFPHNIYDFLTNYLIFFFTVLCF